MGMKFLSGIMFGLGKSASRKSSQCYSHCQSVRTHQCSIWGGGMVQPGGGDGNGGGDFFMRRRIGGSIHGYFAGICHF